MILQDLPLFALGLIVAILSVAPLCDRAGALGRFARNARLFEAAYFGAVLLTLFACRYPVLVWPHELNVDESQFAAQALGYSRTWVPFSQDGNTCGPLNYYVLMWPLVVGGPVTFFTLRLTGLVFNLLTLYFIVRTLGLVTGRRLAYPTALPLVAFYCFAYQPGFVHYSSEVFPNLLLAAAVWIIARVWRRHAAPVFLLGAILGSVPFTKLQAAPLAVYLFGVAFVLLCLRGWPAWKAVLRLAAGGLAVPFLIALAVCLHGTAADAIQRYLVVNLTYGSGVLLTEHLPYTTLVFYFAKYGPQFTLYFGGMMGCALLGAVVLAVNGRRRVNLRWLAGLLAIALYLAAAIGAVIKPDLAYHHYLLLLLLPGVLLPAWILRGCVRFGSRPVQPRLRLGLKVVLMLLAALALPLFVVEQYELPYLSSAKDTGDRPVTDYIESVTKPGDSMANWGYTPRYYVATQVPPVVRDFASFYEFFPGKIGDYYRDGYIADLKRTRPKVIVDSVGESYMESWPQPPEAARATAFPALAQFLAQNYLPPHAITTDAKRLPVLVYVRKD